MVSEWLVQEATSPDLPPEHPFTGWREAADTDYNPQMNCLLITFAGGAGVQRLSCIRQNAARYCSLKELLWKSKLGGAEGRFGRSCAQLRT